MSWIRALAASVILSLTGCDATPSADACTIDDIPQDLAAALCSGDGDRLSKVVFDSNHHRDASTEKAVLHVFRDVWRRDRSVGRNLPWQELESPAVQRTLIENLAQGVRNRRLELSMEDLQHAAPQLLEAEETRYQFDAIRLLGMTDSAADVSLLKRIASADCPSSRPLIAIDALAYICDPSARRALEELARGPRNNERISNALKSREHGWCSGAPREP